MTPFLDRLLGRFYLYRRWRGGRWEFYPLGEPFLTEQLRAVFKAKP